MQKGLLALVLGLAAVAHAGDEPSKVLDCMRANVPLSVKVQNIELISTDRSGSERKIKGKLYVQQEASTAGSDGLVRAALRIKEPANLAGAAYLVREASKYREQGMYVYLPSVRRVKRISGEFADGSLLGSDFSYNDFQLIQNAFGERRPTLETAGKVENRDAYVLSFKPTANTPLGYSQVRAWVDQKTCVPLKLEFYQGKNLIKQLLAPVAGLKQSGTHWYSSELEMSNLKAGTKSLLKILELSSDEKLPKRIFDPALFYVGG